MRGTCDFELRVRVLSLGSCIRIVEMVFNLGNPSSPGHKERVFLTCRLIVLGVGSFAAWNAAAQLTIGDVQAVIAQAVSRAVVVSSNSVVAVTDREGHVLGVWDMNPSLVRTKQEIENAITKAGTAAFLSSDQHAFSTRTAGFIVQQNFPPGVLNRPPGPLVGVNFSQLPFSDINRLKGPGSVIAYGSSPAGANIVTVPIPATGGLAGTPGGLPLFKGGMLVGGVGVAGDGDGPADITPLTIANSDVDEDVARSGQIGFEPAVHLQGLNVLIDGIRLEYVASETGPAPVIPFGSLPGVVVSPYAIMASPAPFAYPLISLGGLTNELRQPIQADPVVGLIAGQPRLTASEVTSILARAAARTRSTRAGIRLPRGQPARVWITVVNNPGTAGMPPTVLGTLRTPDATIFSWDVAVQKARTAVFFSSNVRAYTTRAVGFLAQALYPPGLQGTQPGIFLGLQEKFSLFPAGVTNPLNGAVVAIAQPVNPNLPNGITIFPGGIPLYRNGVLIGAIGVSGDGIDQDDLVAASGAEGFLAPESARADRSAYRGARLPYVKFPRNPAL